MQVVDGLFEAGFAAEGVDQFDQGADAVQRRDLEHVGVVEVEHAFVDVDFLALFFPVGLGLGRIEQDGFLLRDDGKGAGMTASTRPAAGGGLWRIVNLMVLAFDRVDQAGEAEALEVGDVACGEFGDTVLA